MLSRTGTVAIAIIGISVLGALPAAAQAPLSATAKPGWRELNPVTPLSAESFAHPPLTDRPWVRVNTPADLTSEELQAEVAEMKQHGIAGLEIGQGSFPRTPQLVAILRAANAAGLKVSLSHGPTTSPAGYSYDQDNVRKTLVFTAVKVNAGSTADVDLKAPLPAPPRGFGGGGRASAAPLPPRRSTLIAVIAYRCAAATCEAGGPVSLDPASFVELTSTLTDADKGGVGGRPTIGHIRWTAPAAGQWQVIGLWSQGVQMQPDLYSKEGTDELIKGMESDWTTEVKALLKANGGDIFYDSHSVDRGSPTELWTNNMEAEFKARRGYSIIQNAPALFAQSFSFSDGSAPRVRNDLNAVRGDLWIEKHIRPMEAWAHTFNYRIRLQPYGEMTTSPDEIEAASVIDRPETESLFFGDEVDSFLPIASANHVTGNTWFSTECCAALAKAYAQTFQDAIIRMHREYAAGVTRLVYHVYPYSAASDAKWPGYHSFGPAGFSNAWGPRNPFWIDANVYNDYIGRTQQVLTQGEARVDVAVYMQSYLFPQPMQIKGGFHIWPDTRLQEAGFTHDYLDPTLLAMTDTASTAGHVTLGKPAYKALVLDSEQQPASDPVRTSMPLGTARRIATLAKAGLPIIIVGAPPNQTPGRTPAEDATLRAAMTDLATMKNVHQAAHESDVPGLLFSLGIHPDMAPKDSSPVLSAHRHDAAKRTDFYFLYNEGMVTPPNEPTNLFEPAEGKPFDSDIHLQGEGKPYLLNAWSGQITPITSFTAANGGVTIHLKIAPDDAAIIALSPVAMSSTPAPSRAVAGANLPAPINLTGAKWHLSVEDWKPANDYATTGPRATETSKNVVQLDIEGLKAWPQIPVLKDVSGVGTYTADFDLPASWKTGAGVELMLGEVFDSFTVTLNGKSLPVDQISAAVEVGPYLHAGPNKLVVRVATTLNNRLSSLEPTVAKRGLIQNYGLIGPVVLTPHN